MKRLYRYFERKVDVPRIRVGKRQTIETLINEEALLLAKYLRDERKTWTPRIAVPMIAIIAPINVDLTTHIEDITKLLFYEDLRDTMLVGHSYAGMVITWSI